MKRVCLLSVAVVTAFAQSAGTWTDSSAGLMWTSADTDAPVTYGQASYYCSHLALGGHTGWRLPTIDELQKLFGGPPNASGHHILGPLKLTGWQWSSTPGREKGEAWALDFGDGARSSVVMGDSGLNRALCARKL